MHKVARVRTAACLLVVGLVLLLLAAPSSSAAGVSASLHISPGHYVGGQRLTFEGNIGVRGERRVHLQVNLDRPGDEWKDVDDFGGATTNRDGSFRFRYLAPSMFGIQMRVVSGRAATPAVTFRALSQDLVLEAPRSVSIGEQFQIAVDTTPNSDGERDLVRRTDLPPPAYPGRTLTLQRRTVPEVGVPSYTDQWVDQATTTTDGQGEAVFEGVATDDDAVYRVVQAAWTEDGSRIGWYPSFPTYVDVTSSSRTVAPPAARTVSGTTEGVPLNVRDVASTTAAETFRWRPSLWDYGWTYGESLTSGPSRGTDPVGRWVDFADGTGRAAKHNGGVMLDSERENRDDTTSGRSYGTTAITMRGNPMRYGRWEVRLRSKSTETHARDPRVRVELVPDDHTQFHCGAQNITVAEVRPHGSDVEVGARSLSGSDWTRTIRDAWQNGASVAFAVEVTRSHITWFVEGRVVATLENQEALSGVPMTLRLSMGGDGLEEINRTQVISDWQRGYSLERGDPMSNGAPLTRGTYAGGC